MGPADKAKQYFVDMGFQCPPRQTTADFLTAVTDPHERKPLPGFEGRLPRTPKEFEEAFKASEFYAQEEEHRLAYQASVQEANPIEEFKDATKQTKQKHVSMKDPYTINFIGQVKTLTIRQVQLTRGDMTSIVSRYGSNVSEFSIETMPRLAANMTLFPDPFFFVLLCSGQKKGSQSHHCRFRVLAFASDSQRYLHSWRCSLLLVALQLSHLAGRAPNVYAGSPNLV